MQFLIDLVNTVNAYLSDYVLIVLLVGVGLFYSFRTKFVQIRCFGEGMRKVFGKISLRGKRQKSGLSSFQALATAIAAQVGTGNIVGACGAILIGGPGAIFWMWVIAFFGMATTYAEAVLAQKTRVVGDDGLVLGGPVYYIRKAFKGRFGKILAGFFAVATILALGFMGAMVQSNSIASTLHTAIGIEPWIVGIAVAVLSGIIFIGGVQRLAAVTEKLVPLMALLYIVGSLAIIVCRIRYIPETLGMIFKYAFVPQAILGGTIGTALKSAISQGAKRGLFSNEAGMGSTPHAHAMANVETPHDQGVVAMIGVFIDTFIVLTLTAIVVISTLYAGDGILSSGIAPDGVTNTNMTQLAFGSIFTEMGGNLFVAICLLFFAFSTILGWNLFAKINVVYLFGKKARIPFAILAVVFVFLGSSLHSDFVWGLADLFNQLMVIPNVLAMFLLSGTVVSEVRSARERKQEKKRAAKESAKEN